MRRRAESSSIASARITDRRCIRMRSELLALAALIALPCVSDVACAQGRAQREAADYPAKPIRFVVPSTPGGGADVLARTLGTKLAEGFGKPVVMENRAGAGGIIGYEIVA